MIGISRYKTLPEEAQLQFPDRDAQEIYTALISAEAGQFPAENVPLPHRGGLLANMRNELGFGFPPWRSRTTGSDLFLPDTDSFQVARLTPGNDIDRQNIPAHQLSNGNARQRDWQPDSRQMESPADRFLPQRRHHARSGSAADQPDLTRSEPLAVLPHRQPRPGAILRERAVGWRPWRFHVLRH